MKIKDNFISANNQMETKQNIEICQNYYLSIILHTFKEYSLCKMQMPVIKNTDRAETDKYVSIDNS